MNDPKDEFTSLSHRVRYYQRQSRVSWAAFILALALLAVFIGKTLETKGDLAEVEAMYREFEQAHTQLEETRATMHHHILSTQGRLNACRVDNGLPAINWRKYQ